MFIGKILGFLGGWLISGGNIIVALLGLLIGHFFDKGLRKNFVLGSAPAVEKAREVFFETCFSVMGHVAKADGRVSEREVQQAEAVMAQFGMTGQRRTDAIAHFKRGVDSGFDLDATLARYQADAAMHASLNNTLLMVLITVALADGAIDASERRILGRVASALGLSERAFSQLLRMIEAQQRFHQHSQQQAGAQRVDPSQRLAEAYEALGVSPDVNDRALKTAYRKLMSQHHPDKLMAQGVPEDMLKIATQKSQDIQAAYELIREHRKRQ